MDHRPSCDILIVGAGSAGCVLARQLVSLRGFRVTLIEPPSVPASPVNRERPANWIRLLGSDDDWDYLTQPEAGLAGRTLHWPRGRGLGGSSRINAMIWMEPSPSDIQRWIAASGGAWKFDQIDECLHDVRDRVRPEPPRWMSDSSKRFLAATNLEPTGRPMVYKRVNRAGRRWNPATLLDEFSADDRLRIVRAHVDRVVYEQDRAVGVDVDTGCSHETIPCRRHVVLCAGTIATPCILMRSGIGPRHVLADHDIDVRIDLPGVGENLADHLIMPVVFGLPDRDRFPTRWSPTDVARWQTIGSGPLTSNLAECGGLFADDRLQLHVTPTHYATHPSDRSAAAMTIGVNVTDPRSRGRVTIRTACPSETPVIEPRYLADSDDVQTTIEGVRLARRIAKTAPLADWVTDELLPGTKRADQNSLAKSVARYSQTLYHPTGTCAMGTDELSVVDWKLSVRGIHNISVVDASVLPQITQCNPNAAVMTIANHFARRLLE